MRNSIPDKPLLLKQKQKKGGEPKSAATATITLYELMMDLFAEPKRPPARETRTRYQRQRLRANA